jgi:uncharacterized membrane protein
MFFELITFILYVWTITLPLQLLGAVWSLVTFRGLLADQGWALGRVISWLFLGSAVWFISHLQVPANTSVGLIIIFSIYLLLTLYFAKKHFSTLIAAVRQAKVYIAIQETLFLIGLSLLTTVRSFNPHLRDLEKPMDAGFIATYLRAPTLPATDMWLAGETINYYTFGHFLGSIISRLWHLPVSFSYNLLLAFIFGLALIITFSLIINLLHLTCSKSSPLKFILAGLVGSWAVLIGGNFHTFWYFLKNGSWSGYWYADATRFIPNTIHEFPSYSFVVADIHAHVWNLPFVLTFLLLFVVWFREVAKAKPSPSSASYGDSASALINRLLKLPLFTVTTASLGYLLGVFIMTSTWDALIYSLLLVISGLVLVAYDSRKLSLLIIAAIGILITSTLVALPWLLNFESISEGVGLVTGEVKRSPLWQLAVLWSGHLALSFLAVTISLYHFIHSSHRWRGTLLIVLVLALTAWLLIILPELVYVKDIYSGHPRANTMFKLTYQSFILLSVLGAWLFGYVLTAKFKPILKISLLILTFLIIAAHATFPFFAYPGYYGGFKRNQGLHGYRWLYEAYPNDYAAIFWLNQNAPNQTVILEAVGESYTDYARVSAITGLPTVLGWRVHQWLWRGGFDIPRDRTEEVRTVYLQPQSTQATNVLNQYQVQFIIVGEKEYEAYPSLNPNEVKRLGRTVFQQGRTLIIERAN